MALQNARRSRPTDAIALRQADHHQVRQLFRVLGQPGKQGTGLGAPQGLSVRPS
jgi:hypothetical protein